MTQYSVGYDTTKTKAIGELQRLKTKVVAGAAADANIAVAGIAMVDTLQSVVMFAAGVPSDVTSDTNITSAGNIQLNTINSTGNMLVVNFWDKTA